MFILKLGAEALYLKSECLESKSKDNSATSNSDASSTSSMQSESNGRMLKNLLNGYLVESALLPYDLQVKRCKSVTASSKSVFLQSCTSEPHRPRSDTAPQSSFLSQNKLQLINNQTRKRKIPSNEIQSLNESILFESLSKQIPTDTVNLKTHSVTVVSNKPTMLPLHGIANLDFSQAAISESQSTYSTLSLDEMKKLREQINIILKKVMLIIRSYSNYSSISESRKFSFVSELWYRVIVLLIIQMDSESCRFLFRWLLLSIFNCKDELDCSRRDKILLLEKLQEYSKTYFWLKTNSELLHCILFWFFSHYGYPDVFFMSPQVVMSKLNAMVIDNGQLNSILKLIQELSELTEARVCNLFCQHLPTTSSMGEFLIQWT